MKFFIKFKAAAWLLTMWIIILGIFSLITIPRDIQPEVKINLSSINTILPGATPSDIESLITKPLEKEISTLTEIKKITSSSAPGISIIVTEFEQNVDLDKANDKLKERVESTQTTLPKEASNPTITKIESDTVPAIIFSIAGERSLPELTQISEDIQKELEKIPGISHVKLTGGQEKIIEITVNQDKAKTYGLTLENIANLIQFSNLSAPLGTITTDQLNYSIRIDNRYENLNDIRNLPLFSFPDNQKTTIYLSDIATITESYEEKNIISKLTLKDSQPRETVSLQIFKKDGTNVLKIVDESKKKLQELKESTIPRDIEIAISNDNSVFIRTDLGILTTNGIQTTILIIILLFLSMGFFEGFIAGLSIPLTLLFSFIFIDLSGMTINSLTLFALVIALGLMVDNAIVIMEGIHDNIKKGLNSTDAAVKSVDTYKWPLIAGTVTTIFAFFPMLLVSGIVGEFLRGLPITISIALTGSLLISLTISPIIIARLLQNQKKCSRALLSGMFKKLSQIFHNIIYWIIQKNYAKILIVTLSIILFGLSIAMPITGVLKAEMFPPTDMQFFIINIETKPGTTLKDTEKVVEKIEKEIFEIPEMENFLTMIGTDKSQAAIELIELEGTQSSHLANITVNLTPKENRERKSYEIADEMREKFKNFPEAKITIKELSEGPPSEAPVTVRIIGENINTLKKVADDIENIVKNIPGTHNIDTNIEDGLDEFKFSIDQDKAVKHGLNTAQAATLARNAIQGIAIGEISLDNEDLSMLVKYDIDKNNLSIDEIKNIPIPSPNGYLTDLGEIINFDLTKSLSVIERENQKRIVKIRSDVSVDKTALEVTQKIEKQLEDYQLPDGYTISFGGDKEEIKQSFNDLFKSMIVGIILIAFTLVLMFNSFWQPLIILFTLPLAIIGVFPGLWLLDLQLSFPAFLGIVGLGGVAVNDAIVLIDRINKNRLKGVEFKEAIAEATKSRLQPIIMTSITTIVGILPLAISNDFWRGLGFSLIFGLASSTILTLIVIPVVYYMFEVRGARKLKQPL